MISAKFGRFLDKPLAPLARRIPISPSALTILGFLIMVVAAISILFNLVLGGLLLLLGGIFDMFDGIVARVNSKSTKFGAFLDSTLDRYSDSFTFVAVIWHFFEGNDLAGVIFTAGSLVGALLTSYVRSRSEGIGIRCDVGLIERPERVILLIIGCVTGWLLYIVIVLFFLGHITVIQRILHVRKMNRLEIETNEQVTMHHAMRYEGTIPDKSE
ncbi:CDP-alcohol phosphatidyltransferase family protein [Thermodesulfovibrionales bacterium]|nr:CDP-alcohol phosphatidyltransferase family protein [Thermodesulfovibrionales bacterium]